MGYPPLCNSHALVQATVGVGTVLIPYFCVAITKGGGDFVSATLGAMEFGSSFFWWSTKIRVLCDLGLGGEC